MRFVPSAQSDLAAERAADQYGVNALVLPDLPYHAIWCRVGDPAVPGGHADSFATSLALYLRPKSIRVDRIANPHSDPVDWEDPDLDFRRYSSSGVIGDPTHASAAAGKRLWRAAVGAAADRLKEVAETAL